MYSHLVVIYDFHHHIKGGWSFTLQDRFLCVPSPRFLVSQGNRLDAADKVGQRRIHYQVFQSVAMCRAYQLHSTLSDSSSRLGFEFSAYFIDNDDLGHVIFHRFNHYGMLFGGSSYLHSPGMPDGGMRNVSIPGNFVGGVNYDNPFLEVISQHPGHLSQHSGLAYARPSQQQDVSARFDKVLNHPYGAEHSPAHTAGQ